MTEQQLDTTRLANLAKANEVRLARADDKKAIGRGELSPVAILRDPPPHWQTTGVLHVFLAMPHIGRVKAMSWCKMEQVNPAIHIGQLTDRQREMLAWHIDVWVDRRDDLRRALERRTAA